MLSRFSLLGEVCDIMMVSLSPLEAVNVAELHAAGYSLARAEDIICSGGSDLVSMFKMRQEMMKADRFNVHRCEVMFRGDPKLWEIASRGVVIDVRPLVSGLTRIDRRKKDLSTPLRCMVCDFSVEEGRSFCAARMCWW